MKYIILVIVALFSGCNIEPDCSDVVNGGIFGKVKKHSEACDYNFYNMPLTSTGGSTVAAVNIGSEIRTIENSLAIADDYCASSCAIIFSAASHRQLCPGTWLGLHQGNIERATNRMMNFFAQDERIDYNWINSIITNTPHEKVYWLSAYDAIRIGLADEIVTCDRHVL